MQAYWFRTGNLRFQPPQPITSYNTSFSATTSGPSCPNRMQHYLFLPACMLRPLELPHTHGLQHYSLPKTVSLIDDECIGVEQTLLQGLTVTSLTPADATPESTSLCDCKFISISAVAGYESLLVDLRKRFGVWKHSGQPVSDISLMPECRNGDANHFLF